ncbi:MAG: ATP-binding protein [Rhodocyclaceae bacterium]|nr:ATP-binding protein [Rhodocyclaceae bacterium]
MTPTPSPAVKTIENPYRPGAGHKPPFLAGRTQESADVERYFDQEQILSNIVLTGLRGVGKTVLLEELRKPAVARKWFWVGTDLSESASVSEENMAIRLITDLAVVTSGFEFKTSLPPKAGFTSEPELKATRLDFHFLRERFQEAPGLVADKLKYVLELCWEATRNSGCRGIIFAYDESQNLADQTAKEQYPLSMLLEVFQSIQRKGIPFMLLLTGLPTLFQKLVEARTYAERMFHVITLDRLKPVDSEAAITVPIRELSFKFTPHGIERIIELSGGYPYFIQFICRESYDLVMRGENLDESRLLSIIAKLDSDFFAGRWARATDRQRDLLNLIAELDTADNEFSVQEIVEVSKRAGRKPFSGSHVNQMLSSLSGSGLIFKNRHGKYAFAVPLLSRFIKRQAE